MGHEAILYGRIEGASWRAGERFTWLHQLNAEALAGLPDDDAWPCIVRGSFALPAPFPQGTYRRQIIHFGASIKDDPSDPAMWNTWLGKFEAVLVKLYWFSATVHLETELEAPRVFQWLPTPRAIERLAADPPSPVTEWSRSMKANVG